MFVTKGKAAPLIPALMTGEGFPAVELKMIKIEAGNCKSP